MKATPLIINWHDQNAPVYAAHFEPGGQCRLATAGGDNHVRIWKLESSGLERKVHYLCTLSKHNQAVNVVRWAPKGEVIASAGDDGNVILWVPSDLPSSSFGTESQDDKESWRAKHMCRSSGAEIYDLAWSPDAAHFIIGSMDNVARIYSATTGALVRQVAEHSHYVQGVTWDPLNEFIATQSSDRSVHIYSLRTKDGQYTLSQDGKLPRLASHIKADLPPRRISSNSPAPPEFGHRSQFSALDSTTSVGSPIASQPGTPTSVALPMNPPSVVSHSRRSSFSSRRSASPAPSMPLPAVMPLEASPKPHFVSSHLPPITKNASLYANETLTSFFRRLTFTPDGSLLMTPSGQYQTQHQSEKDAKPTLDIINTVYIYTRGGINKPPIAHLPGHKKPSIAVKCSPVVYTLRHATPSTRHITIDTSSADESLPSLPEPVSKSFPPVSVMEPPPHPLSSSHAENATTSAKAPQSENEAATPSPKPAFSLPYRMVYAVATQDAVLLYDTQQKNPLCVVSNLHCATFTDLTWSNDGLTLVISSSDGFCSTLSFAAGELGEVYKGEIGPPKAQAAATAATGPSGPSNTGTPTRVPGSFAPPSPHPNGALQHHRNSVSSLTASSPPAAASTVPQRPSSPARSNSASSVATQSSSVHTGVASNPHLISGSVPGLTAAGTGSSNNKAAIFPMSTPPETPHSTTTSINNNNNVGGKREASESEKEEGKEAKRRRIVPTTLGPKPT